MGLFGSSNGKGKGTPGASSSRAPPPPPPPARFRPERRRLHIPVHQARWHWEYRQPLPYPDMTLPHRWHLDPNRIPVPAVSMMTELNSTGEIISALNGSVVEHPYQDTVTIYYKSIYRTFNKILTTLTAIDLSNNSFDGTIPGSLGRLTSLHVLNMSGNAFIGHIPQVFGRMTQLESLDLSQNQLSGDIPAALTNLNFLGILNLSNNQLVGRIPQSGQFATFENNSFEGNLGLCGPPLSNPCGISPAPPSTAHADDSSHVDVVLFLFSGLGFGVGFAAAILMRWGRIGKWFVKSARALRT